MVDVAPAAIVADGGTETLALLEFREKLELLAAGPARLMVHVLLPGVWIVVGAQVNVAPGPPASSVIVMVLVLLPKVAVRVGL